MKYYDHKIICEDSAGGYLIKINSLSGQDHFENINEKVKSL